MRQFLLRAGAFSIPWLLYALAIIMVDPFDRFGVGHVVPETSKATASPVYSNALWKVIQFNRSPGDNITLGASGMNHIKPELIKEVSGLEYRNLTVNGASLVDIIRMFWSAAGRIALKRVCVGVHVALFNRSTDRDTVSGALATAGNPLAYLTNRDVLAASVNLVGATYFGGQLKTDAPPMDREAFWRHMVTYGATRNFYEYRFDDDAYRQLGEIAAYCRSNNIELKFVILPVHRDIHEQIQALGAAEAWTELKGKLQALGETYDFDVDDEMTRDRSQFTDPFHFNDKVARLIARQVFGGASARGGP